MSDTALQSGHVRTARSGPVLHVTLDRPDKRNALTRAMYEDLSRVIEQAENAPDIHVLCLSARGDMFCAGNDIADFAAHDPATGDAGTEGPALGFITRLAACDKATVAAVQGQATGIGTTLLLHVDLVIAADDARFHTAFIDLALVPEAGSSLLLPALVGRQNAHRLLLAGDTLDADEALRMGLVAYVVPRVELGARMDALAERLAAKSPAAIAASKQLLREAGAADTLNRQIAREAEVFGQRLASEEVTARLNAFLSRHRG